MRLPPATVHLRRAQLTLMLAVLIPTVLMTAMGIILLALGSDVPTVLAAVLILSLCTTGITGYILGSIFVGRGASLARIQHDFLGSVSHELRTPLTSIGLLLESLRDGRLSGVEQTQVLALLGQETKRLEMLVGRLLELSRLDIGAHVFAHEPIAVPDLIGEAVRAFDAASLGRPTPVTLDLEPGLVVQGDRATLVVALVNLLVNAWKYTAEDKRIAIIARGDRRWIRLSVRDNGIGMNREDQRMVFGHFTRSKAAIDRRIPGFGLGLAFVRAIIRGHRGKIELESALDAGTTITLRLRRRKSAPITAALPDPRPQVVRSPT